MRKLIAVLLLSSIYYSDVIHVPGDHATIQEGINASVNFDTVIVAQGTYYENIILGKEIVLASNAIYDELGADWQANENINNTVISGDHNGSAMIIRYGNIEPTVLGFTFQDGIGTSMVLNNCNVSQQKRSGGAILIYKAYPTINYNRFINNGFEEEAGGGGTSESVADGGAISHYATDDVEFDEDRNHSSGELTYVDFSDSDAVRDYILQSAIEDPDESNTTRTIPDEINMQNNYFANNSAGDGENYYSHGFEGSIDVSHSTFENIDCESNTVNKFILRSLEDEADYIQDDISGQCIEESIYYVSAQSGDDNNLGTETDPFKTIGQALTLVRDNGTTVTTINLYPGVHSPSTNRERFPIILPDNVHLIGDESETTILDAEADPNNEATVIIIKEVENVTVANMTLTGGSSEGNGCTGGGGLLITADDMFNADSDAGANFGWNYALIENVIIEGNESHNGGGLSIYRSRGSVLNNVIIRDNEASAFGGGVFTYGSQVNMTNVTVTGNNNLTGTAMGGGMMMPITSGTLDNMTITDNEGCCGGGGVWTNGENCTWVMTNSIISGNSGDWGGGFAVLGGDETGATPTLINVTISDNTALSNGGGVWSVGGSATFENCTITGNTALNADMGGGAMWVMGDGNTSLTDCLVSDNSAPNSTAGIWAMNVTSLSLTGVTITGNSGEWNPGVFISDCFDNGGFTPAYITNSTITGNSSSNGGAIRVTCGGHAEVVNSIVWDNNTPYTLSSNGGTGNATYSNIDGGSAGEGNIDADPLFVDAGNGDYSLQEGSPCIDAGTADVNGDGVDDITDYFGTAPDMGAFEYLVAVEGLQYYADASSVTLYWTIVPDAQYYNVERSTDPLFETDVVSDFSPDAFYVDDDLEWDTEYFYRVAAFIGYWTDYSNVVSVTLEFVGISDGAGVPETYAVHQNYPNPFNPVTTLRYDLPEDGLVNITVYDMMGRAVKTLVNEHQTAGYRSTHWNATNDAGSPLSAGMYLYTIQAGDFRQTRKMILLK